MVVLSAGNLDTFKRSATVEETGSGCLDWVPDAPAIKHRPTCFFSYRSYNQRYLFWEQTDEMMLDFGSAVSWVRQDIVKSCNIISQMPLPQIQLVTASGDKLPIKDYVKIPIEL